ncbi:hypothetical protein FIBSPDRAFT_757416 [Athelia psychrophila]|uniref:DNA breaking-rejoining enzyme n=1 Tax=Athelia psychrophila TaxID=1759441 RepID=A0A165ZUZ8_9AGAM|nr:hypothetical protein FIBSPDRAFT_757416 [Fibularhizoctonia sp. CBS 109695]
MASRGLLWTQRPLILPPSYSTSATEITQSLLPGPCGATSQTPPHPYALTVPNVRFASALTIPSAGTSRPRPYAPNLVPLVSVSRPHCLAWDRLQLWLPQAKQLPGCAGISNDDLDRILAVIAASYAEGTRETYGSGLLIYHVFCDQRQIPELERCPVCPALMLTFIANCAGAYSGKTLATYVFAVRAWHTIHGQVWATNDAEMKAALTGAAKLAPPKSKKPKRAPWTITLLQSVCAALNPSNPLHVAVKSAATAIFFSAARTGEFLQKTLTSFDPKLHVKPSNLSKKVDRDGNTVTSVHLPVTKVAPDGEDVAWGPQQIPGIDPDTLLAEHMRINKPAPNGPLFAWRHTKGPRALTKAEFMKCINDTTNTLGLDHMQGHSLQIGATLEYLLRGLSFETVKAIGCWSSDAFILYLRQHAVILAPYLQGTPIFSEFNRIVMPPPR